MLLVQQPQHRRLPDLQQPRRHDGVAGPDAEGLPASAPSPTKSPGPNIATTASLPALETTDSLTLPSWM